MMTTSELVVRIAAFFGGWPHEVWAFPFHYYLHLRREYLKIMRGPTSRSTRRMGGHPNITVETFEAPG